MEGFLTKWPVSVYLIILTFPCFLVQEGSTDSLYELPQVSRDGQELSPVPIRRPYSPKCLADSGKWGGSEPCIALVSITGLPKLHTCLRVEPQIISCANESRSRATRAGSCREDLNKRECQPSARFRNNQILPVFKLRG